MSPSGPFEDERKDINTRALISRVQDEVRVINGALSKIASTVDAMSNKIGVLSEELAALIAHKEHAVTWFKLLAVACAVVAACWGLVQNAKSEMRADTEERNAAHAQRLDEKAIALEADCNKVRNKVFELEQRVTKPAGGRR